MVFEANETRLIQLPEVRVCQHCFFSFRFGVDHLHAEFYRPANPIRLDVGETSSQVGFPFHGQCVSRTTLNAQVAVYTESISYLFVGLQIKLSQHGSEEHPCAQFGVYYNVVTTKNAKPGGNGGMTQRYLTDRTLGL